MLTAHCTLQSIPSISHSFITSKLGIYNIDYVYRSLDSEETFLAQRMLNTDAKLAVYLRRGGVSGLPQRLACLRGSLTVFLRTQAGGILTRSKLCAVLVAPRSSRSSGCASPTVHTRIQRPRCRLVKSAR